MMSAFDQYKNNELPKPTGDPVSSVLVKRDRMITETTQYDIYVLSQPTKGGSTHVAVNSFGDPVILLSMDQEGCWLVDQQITTGKIDSFYERPRPVSSTGGAMKENDNEQDRL